MQHANNYSCILGKSNLIHGWTFWTIPWAITDIWRKNVSDILCIDIHCLNASKFNNVASDVIGLVSILMYTGAIGIPLDLLLRRNKRDDGKNWLGKLAALENCILEGHYISTPLNCKAFKNQVSVIIYIILLLSYLNRHHLMPTINELQPFF